MALEIEGLVDHHDARQPAFVLVNELLRKHFAVLGATGSGKSCAVSLLLSAILADCPMARAFGRTAEVVNINNLQLPFWLFDFEEAVGILVRGGTAQEQEAQALIPERRHYPTRRHYAGESHAATMLSVDTPTPFRVSDLLRFISEAMGRLDKPDTSMPYLRLKTRLETMRHRPQISLSSYTMLRKFNPGQIEHLYRIVRKWYENARIWLSFNTQISRCPYTMPN